MQVTPAPQSPSRALPLPWEGTACGSAWCRTDAEIAGKFSLSFSSSPHRCCVPAGAGFRLPTCSSRLTSATGSSADLNRDGMNSAGN